MICSTEISLRKVITIIYATLSLGQKTVRAVLKIQDGKIVNELKIKKQADNVPEISRCAIITIQF